MTGSRPTWDEVWLRVAAEVATRSLCVRDQVGAVIVDPGNRIVATGYNGPPAGFPHMDLTCDRWCSRAKPTGRWEPHKNAQIIDFLTQGDKIYLIDADGGRRLLPDPHRFFAARGWRYVEDLSPCYEDCPALHGEANALSVCDRSQREGGTIYITGHVCYGCAKLVANSGLNRVVVRHRTGFEYRAPTRSYQFLADCLGLGAVTIYDEQGRVLTYDTFKPSKMRTKAS